MKKMSLMMCAVLVCTALAGCGGKEPLQGESQTEIGTEQNTQVQEENEATEQVAKSEADDLLDKFLAGEMDADRNGLYGEGTFNISDLQMDVEDWASYSIGERLDLDNDGENEQILNGPYGGIYLDASDGKVKVFACGEGTAWNLSYTLSEDEVWIVYSDTTHAGRDCYFLEKYSGAEEVVEKVSLKVYFEENVVTYYVDEQEVSLSVFKEELEKYFGTSENFIGYVDWLEEIQAEEEIATETDFSGVYTDTMGTDDIYSELILVKREDGDYNFEIGLHRLTSIGGKAIQDGDNLHFVGIDASGEPIEGDVVISGESATATFTDSTWTYIENGDTYTFPSGKLEIDELPEDYLDFYYTYEWKE
ncbi:MAG: hypothetical protein IKB01_09780 [Lachnospiraceae bacterium]|nr:hypothetical protein [Lachnospiraceae bacterium]